FILMGMSGTVLLWLYSAVLAIMFAIGLCFGSLSLNPIIYFTSRFLILLGRGIPTSLYVVAAGIICVRLMPSLQLPEIFPGTLPAFQIVGLTIVVVLAFGSAGHLAEILLAGRRSIGRERLAQMQIMGLDWKTRVSLTFRESAPQVLPAISARLVHHLHNTAFAALFPVVELFGVVQSGINRSFAVALWVGVGAGLYILLSSAITAAGSALEQRFAPKYSDLNKRVLL
ncbi:MAG: hypothetical protein AAFZ92_09225, partial [Pseudomonadota bacterium]